MCARAATMAAWTEVEAAEWLGAENSEGDRELKLPDRVVQHLVQAFKDGIWDEDDIVQEGETCTKADVDTWKGVFTDADAKKKTSTLVSDIARFLRWLHAFSGDDEDASSKYKPSETCVEDIKTQGASTYHDINFLDVSLFLGRPAGKSDLVDSEYGTPASRSKGGKDAVKYKLPTFETAMAASKREVSLAPVQTFILQTTNSLQKGCDHQFAASAAARINNWWMRGNRALEPRGVLAVLTYFEDYRIAYRGRGLPEEFDAEISQRAAGVTESGNPGSSGRHASQGRQKDEEMSSLTSQISDLIKTIKDQNSRIGQLEAEVKGGKKDRCNICGATDHWARNCPEKKSNRKDGEEK